MSKNNLPGGPFLLVIPAASGQPLPRHPVTWQLHEWHAGAELRIAANGLVRHQSNL
jgi:hypothetical protein